MQTQSSTLDSIGAQSLRFLSSRSIHYGDGKMRLQTKTMAAPRVYGCTCGCLLGCRWSDTEYLVRTQPLALYALPPKQNEIEALIVLCFHSWPSPQPLSPYLWHLHDNLKTESPLDELTARWTRSCYLKHYTLALQHQICHNFWQTHFSRKNWTKIALLIANSFLPN